MKIIAVIFILGIFGKVSYANDGQSYREPITHSQILVNQVGYLPESFKCCVVDSNAGDVDETFSVWNIDEKGPLMYAYSGKLRKSEGDFGTYYIGDFSKLSAPGNYMIVANLKNVKRGRFTSFAFRIGSDVYDEALTKGIHWYALQRCGASKTGHHAPCHLDDKIILPDGTCRNASGGWHDATDFWKPASTPIIGLMGLLKVAQLVPELKESVAKVPEETATMKRGPSPWKTACFQYWRNALRRGRMTFAISSHASLFEEIKWGNDYLLKLQDSSGYIYAGAPGDKPPLQDVILTDNIVGTKDDRILTNTKNHWEPFFDHGFIIAECLLAAIYQSKDKEYADRCVEAAKRCFEYINQSARSNRYEWWWKSFGSGIGAGVYLYKVTGDLKYKDYALKMAREFLALQETEYIDGQEDIRGYFYEKKDRNRSTGEGFWSSVVYIYMCDLLETFPEEPDAVKWRESLEMYCDDCLLVFARRNAFGLMPIRVRMTRFAEEGSDCDIFQNSRSVGNLRYYYAGGCGSDTIGLRGILFCRLSKILNRPECLGLAQRQLDFILGANPANLCFMNKIGYNNPPEYICPGIQPRIPCLPGAVLRGFSGEYSRDDRLHFRAGTYQCAEYWIQSQSSLIWLIAELKAYGK